jgi:hypothetical protein
VKKAEGEKEMCTILGGGGSKIQKGNTIWQVLGVPDDVDWMPVAQDVVERQAVVTAVIGILVP